MLFVSAIARGIRQNRFLQRMVLWLARVSILRHLFMKFYELSAWILARELRKLPGVDDCLLHGSLAKGKCRPGVSDIDLALTIEHFVYANPHELKHLIDSAVLIAEKSIIPADVRVYTKRQFEFVGTYGRLSYIREYYSYKQKAKCHIVALDAKFYEISKIIGTFKSVTNLYYYFRDVEHITADPRLFTKVAGHVTRLISLVAEHVPLQVEPNNLANEYSKSDAEQFMAQAWKDFPTIILAIDAWLKKTIPSEAVQPIKKAIDQLNHDKVARNVIYSALPAIQMINSQSFISSEPLGSTFYLTDDLLPRFLLVRPRGIALVADRIKDDILLRYLSCMLLSDFLRRPQTMFFEDHEDAIKDNALYFAVANALITGTPLNCLDRSMELYQPTWDEHVQMWTKRAPDFIEELIKLQQ